MGEVIDFDENKIKEIKNNVNGILWSLPNTTMEHLKLSNKIIERLKDVKIKINYN